MKPPMKVVFLVLTFLTTLCAGTASTRTVTVPDDYAGIQAAIDSAPDTVLVRDGTFREPLVVSRGITLLNHPSNGYNSEAFPQTGSMTVVVPMYGEDRGPIVVQGFRFRGPITLPSGRIGSRRVTFELCRMDSGIAQPGNADYAILVLTIRGCTILGNVTLAANATNFTLNTVIGGAVKIYSDGYHTIRGNYIQSSAGSTGILTGSIGPIDLIANTVVGGGDGVRLSCSKGTTARDNLVRDCAGTAFGGLTCFVDFTNNVASRCQGRGVDLQSDHSPLFLTHNTVDRAGSDGIRAIADRGGSVVDSNVVGRCSGNGIVVDAPSAVKNNTCFLNGQSGFVVAANSIDHNIAFRNQSHGLEWSGKDLATLSCNDWFENGAGAVLGTSPDSTDLSVDPLFCDVDSDRVELRPDSPLLNAPGCGLIGARAGCDDATTGTLVEQFQATRGKDGVIDVRWRLDDARVGQVVVLERALGAEGPWTSLDLQRSQENGETVVIDRTAELESAYFYRLTLTMPGEAAVTTAVIEVPGQGGAFGLQVIGPNPSSGTAQIEFAVARGSKLRLTVLDVQGREVAKLADGDYRPGRYRVVWPASNSRPVGVAGIYFVRLDSPEGHRVGRIAVTP